MVLATRRKRNAEDEFLDQYLEEISQISLISPEEEVTLARLIQQGDEEALNKLVKANLRFVVSVAKQYRGQGLPLSDLINEGNLGLMRAAKRFDEAKGVKFISYAVWWIRQAILQALAEQTRVVRLPMSRIGMLRKIGKASEELEQEHGYEPTAKEIAEELGTTTDNITDTLLSSKRHLSLDASIGEDEESNLLSFLADEMQPSPDDEVMKEALKEEVDSVLSSLTPREAEVLSLYFGINTDQAFTLEEIGKRFGLTRERIRQIKEKAIRRLRHGAQSRKLRPYMN